jgi:hypothetical protein
MARLTLKLGDQVLKEYPVGSMANIGRVADNTISIDNAAVSSHHACIFRDGGDLIVEDLQSTNGTFVNGRRVSRHVLQHGDVVQVGRHTLELDEAADVEPETAEPAEIPLGDEGATIYVDRRQLLAKLMLPGATGRKYDALMARLRDVEMHATRSKEPFGRATAVPSGIGVLRVVDGRADRDEYRLDAHTSLIGKSKSSLVRLRGWFRPNVAVAITRNSQGYVATLLGGEILINSRAAVGRHELRDGDVLDVSGLILEFRVPSSP